MNNNNRNYSRKMASHQRRKNGNDSEKEKSCHKTSLSTIPFAMSEKEIGEIEEKIKKKQKKKKNKTKKKR